VKKPSAEIWSALRAAASSQAVPVSLLAAIAFQESAFDPKAIGPMVKAGWRALGLMQLSPTNIRAYDVTDPLDPSDSANGAARLIKNLMRASDGGVDNVIAAYNWGIGNVNRGNKWPNSVTSYVRGVRSNRAWLLDQAETPRGGTLYERLRAAIVGLYAANVGVREIGELYSSFRSFDRVHSVVPDVDVIKFPVLVTSLARYATLFWNAPITSSATPPPRWLIEGTPVALKTFAAKLIEEPATFTPLTLGDADPTDRAITLTPQVVYGRVETSSSGSLLAVLLAFGLWWAVSDGKTRRSVMFGV